MRWLRGMIAESEEKKRWKEFRAQVEGRSIMPIDNMAQAQNAVLSKAPVDNKEVQVQLNHLRVAVTEIESYISTLMERLAPVLQIEPPKNAGVEGRPSVLTSTPLGAQIAELEGRLDFQRCRLINIHQRLEV